MKKLLLSLGALASVAAPVAAVVACGTTDTKDLDAAKDTAIAYFKGQPGIPSEVVKTFTGDINEAKDVDAVRVILNQEGGAGTADKVLGPKVAVKTGSSKSAGSAEIVAALKDATTTFELVTENHIDTTGSIRDTALVQVGDAVTNHPVRIIFTEAQSKALFGDNFATDKTKATALETLLNTAYAVQNKLHKGTSHVLNTPDYAGGTDDAGEVHAGWNAFDVRSRSGVSGHFGFSAGPTAHVEIIANYRTESLAKAAHKSGLVAIIASLLQ